MIKRFLEWLSQILSEGRYYGPEDVIERFRKWLSETFPERQIYIRRDRSVQFFTFGPVFQATLSILSLLFLGWVSFASTRVIFRERIIDAKSKQYTEMQSAYENRLSTMQDINDRTQTILALTLSTERDALECLTKKCAEAKQQALMSAYNNQMSELQEIGSRPHKLRPFVTDDAGRSGQAVDHQAWVYEETRKLLDNVYQRLTGNESNKLSDDTVFQIMFGVVWAVAWALLATFIAILARILLKKTRKTLPETRIEL